VQRPLLQPGDRRDLLGAHESLDPAPNRRRIVVAKIVTRVLIQPLEEELDFDVLDRDLVRGGLAARVLPAYCESHTRSSDAS